MKIPQLISTSVSAGLRGLSCVLKTEATSQQLFFHVSPFHSIRT